MPRVHLVQTNMTAGELSPDMYGRTDIDRYPNAVKELRNAFATIQGGAKGREGSVFVAPAKFTDTSARLLPFVFNRTQSYILEFGENYMRVFRDHAQIEASPGVPYEIVTPYTADQVMEFDFAQRGDTMFITHQDIPTQRLRRFADDSWDISPAPWVYQPTAELGFRPAADLTLSDFAVGTTPACASSAPAFLEADVGRDLTSAAGLLTITAYTNTSLVTGSVVVAFAGTVLSSGEWKIEGSPQTTLTPSVASPVGAAVTMTLTAAGWRSGDVGKMVDINGGLVELTGYTSTTVMTGKILRELDSTAGAEPLSWTLRSGMWGGENGYPGTCTFHQQRLILAGSPGFPRHVFGSAIGNVLDFLIGIDDADAFATPLADSDEIRYLASVRVLSVMSYNGEFVIEGGVEKAMAPTNLQITNQSNYGIDSVRPVRIGNELYFVQRAGQKLRAFTYRFTEDNFDAPDMTKLANHIVGPGITEMTYQQEPYSRLLCLREDGVIAQVTIDRTEGVVAWARWITEGSYKSLATIPVGDRDETWALVRRFADGNQQMYIEYFDPATHTDCCIQGASVGPVEVWSGLDHLEGLDVAVLADDVVMPEETVTGGEIALPRGAVEVEIGIPFEPYIELLPVEFPTGSGTAQGAQGRTGEVIVRLKDTVGCTIGNPESPEDAEVVPFRQFGLGILDQPVSPFSGDKNINKLGWEQNTGSVFISQPQPLPIHVLSVMRRVTVND